MKKIIVLSGAGISAESGIATFRGTEGLWEGYDVTEVASPEGWKKNTSLVLDFYNQRRKNVIDSQPNTGHLSLVELEQFFDVDIVTQNVDDLHERAGSTSVLHVHGEILKSRSTLDYRLVYNIDGSNLNIGDRCEKGSQLRPHIVWFGEAVPEIENAISLIEKADLLIVVGTSLNVYPAAGLIDYLPVDSDIYLVDPVIPQGIKSSKINLIEKPASIGLPLLVKDIIKKYA